MNNLEVWIGLRYLRAKKRNGFMSFISIISIAGIALGVIALIVVLSVMNGFQRDVRAKLFEVAPHIELGYYQDADAQAWRTLDELAHKNAHVIASTPYITNQALLTNAGEVRGILIQGIDPKTYPAMVNYQKQFTAGSFDELKPGAFNIILGEGLAKDLDAKVGNKITLLTPEGNITPMGMVPRLKQFTVAGIVRSDIYELDTTLSLINLQDAQKLFRMGNNITGLRLRVDNPQDAPEMSASLIDPALQDTVWVRDWSFQNKSYFEAVSLEKKMMFIIMALISAVASFNLVSSLVMTVNEKRADIAILRTLGVSPMGIMKIFITQGAVAGIVGTLSGTIIGVLIALNIGHIVKAIESLAGSSLVNSQVYFLNYVPSYVDVSDVLIISGISLSLSFLATLYPSWRAAKTQPAEALRYE